MFIFLICSRKIYLSIVPKWGLKVPKYFWKYLQFCSKHEIISKQPFWLVGTPLSNHNRRTIIWYNQLQLHILCTYFQSFCPVIHFNASLNLLVLKHIKLGKTWGYRKQSAPSALQVYLKRGLTDLCINKKKLHCHSFIPQIKVWWQHRHTYILTGTDLTNAENVSFEGSIIDFRFTVQGRGYVFRLPKYSPTCFNLTTIMTCVN